MSPEAVTSMIAHLQGATTKSDEADRQVRWFVDGLLSLLGTPANHERLMNKLGI